MNLSSNRPRVLAALAAACAVLAPCLADAAVWNVPTDFRRIDVAVRSVAPGDTIRVMGNGGATYPERLILDKDLTIEGGWRADFLVRDPSLYASVIRDTTLAFQRSLIRVDGPYHVVLDGLTILGGRLGVEAAAGADLEIRDCEIRGQRNDKAGFGDQLGGGVTMEGGTLVLERTRMRDILTAYSGPAVALVGVQSAVIRDCFLERTTTFPFPQPSFPPAPGGAVYAENCGSVLLERVDFLQAAAQLHDGGAVYATGTAIELRSVNASRCFSPTGGGALHFEQCASVVIADSQVEACSGGEGGGIHVEGVPALTITGTRVAGNTTTFEGGGLWIDASTFTLGNDTLDTNNLPNITDVGKGGGVWCQSSNGLVENSLFQGERATAAGGAWFQLGGDVIFRGSTFRNNFSGFFGGALHIELGGSIRLESSLVESNVAKFGGGCSASFTARIELEHCTYTGNTGLSAGAAVHLDTAAQATVSNSILCCASVGDQIHCSAASATVTYSNLWNDDSVNVGSEYGGVCADVTGTSGNLKVDPGFCAGDPSHGLSAASPCVGAASDGGDIGWAGVACARPLSLAPRSWGRIKAGYGSAR